MASLTHRYIPKTQKTEENLFIEEYYSSTDTKIYIDDVEQTEIGYISYSLGEQIKPIYGYASNTFDDVAIGSRIVTGILKTPIVNSEKQSSPDDIQSKALYAAYGTFESTSDYNDSESNNANNTDWRGNTDKLPGNTSSDDYEDDVSYEYRNKLELLGYLQDGSFSRDELTAAIKKFQRDHDDLVASGYLDSNTLDAIDEALEKQSSKASLTIPAGTMIYTTPTRNTPLYARGIPNETKAFVMESFEGGWLYIATVDGIEGCININDNPEFKKYYTAS